MSLLNRLPITSFRLPSGETIQARNIFKTIIFSPETKSNLSILNVKTGVNVSKVDSISYQLYQNKLPLYWIITHLNDIDSFENSPIPELNLKTNLEKIYPGKIYYVKDGKKMSDIRSGDIVVLYSDITTPNNPNPDSWKYAGKVKEFDNKFRRIIIERQIENNSNSDSLPDNAKIFLFRPSGENNDLVVETDSSDQEIEFFVGKIDDELKKIITVYLGGLNGEEISPFREIVDGSPTANYSFQDFPSSDTFIYKYSNGESLPEFFYDTLEKEKIRQNVKNNTIKYLDIPRAFEVSSFVETLFNVGFKRGIELTLDG